MPDVPSFRSGLEIAPGRLGRLAGAPGVTVRILPLHGLSTLMVRKGSLSELVSRAQEHFGVDLPATPRMAAGPRCDFVWSGPGHWLAHASVPPPEGMEAMLAPLSAHAAVVDQSHARVLIEVRGTNVRDLLAKGVPIDLHERAFSTGAAASTVCAHIAIQLWRAGEDVFVLSVARGFAGSFWHWLESSAAEFGLEVEP